MIDTTKRKSLYFVVVLGLININVALAQTGSCQPATDALSGQTYNGVYIEKQMTGTIVADYAKCLYAITDVYTSWLEADS